jgi:hypothetical protein
MSKVFFGAFCEKFVTESGKGNMKFGTGVSLGGGGRKAKMKTGERKTRFVRLPLAVDAAFVQAAEVFHSLLVQS